MAALLHLYRDCFDHNAMREIHPSVRQRDCRIADHLISPVFGRVMDLATYPKSDAGQLSPFCSRVRQLHRGAWTGRSMG
jgi:hypothetical protein